MSNKISIITVNRNNAEGLERTIRSVTKQTYTNYEFIVIDGESTDDSVDIIAKYADQITYWVSEPDSGIFNAMNKGIERASGNYCYFLNSADELISEDTLQTIFGNKEYDAPFINGHQINDYGAEKYRIRCADRPLTLFDFYKSTIKHQATFIRRDLFDTYGLYDENLRIISDWKFFLKTIALHNEQPVYVDTDIVLFEWNGLSTSIEWGEKQQKERQQVLDEFIPKPVQQDYARLNDLTHYSFVADCMKKNKIFDSMVRGLYRIFK